MQTAPISNAPAAIELSPEDLLASILANTDGSRQNAAMNAGLAETVNLLDAVLANTDAPKSEPAPAVDAAPVVCEGNMDIMAALGMGAVGTAPAVPAPAVVTPVVAVPQPARRAAGAAVGLPVTPKQWSYIRHLRGQCRKAGMLPLATKEISNNRKEASNYITAMMTALKNRYQAAPARRPGGSICSVCYTPGCTIGPMTDNQ